MNRLNIRLAKLTARFALVAAAMVALSGCGTGQISQTAAQEPAVNGNRLTVNNVALRDIRLQAVQSSDYLQPGKSVELLLVVTNNSPDVNDRLTGITSEIGNVTMSGDGKLPAGKNLIIGAPEGPDSAPGPGGGNGAAKATVNLSKPISNGLTYKFTFKFEKAGEGTVEVPISAPLAQPREGAPQHS